MSGPRQQFNFQGPVQNVYAPSGDLILSPNSKPNDLAQRIDELCQQIDALPELDAAARAAVTAKLKAAGEESRKAAPEGTTVKGYLDTAAETLNSAAGVADSGRKLAETVLSVGKWAAAFLV